MKPSAIVAVCLLLFSFPAFSQYYTYAYLDVRHPQTGVGGQGTIEEATIVITPMGSFTVNDLFLTFSAGDLPFAPTDSVEVRMYFTLPQQSFVTDLWLWYGADTLHALLADKSKARATYESVVKRRRDPALLTNDWGNYYTLSIYPMRADSSRKVKIRYILPQPISSDVNRIELPLWILRVSKKPLTRTSLIVKETTKWKYPSLLEVADAAFSATTDPAYGNIYKTELSSTQIANALSLTLQLKGTFLTDHLYAEKYAATPTTGVFSMSISPAVLLGIPPQRKMLFLIDYDSTTVSPPTYTKTSRVNELRQALQTSRVEQDSFSVIFSAKGKPHRVADSWRSLDTSTIGALLPASMNLDAILDTVDIAGLLFDGVRFLNENGNAGDIILFASSDRLYDLQVANVLLDSLKKIMNPATRVHILDDNSHYYYLRWYYINGRYYYGNGYFYYNLAQQTNGSYTRSGYHTASNMLSPKINESRGWIDFFKLTTSLASGFTYAEFTSGFENGRLPLLSPATTIGYYEGNFPLRIEFGGRYNGRTYFLQRAVEDSSFRQADSSLESVWASKLIAWWMRDYSYYYDDYVKKQIVDVGMRYRILTYYTAFIALEPGQALCDSCFDQNRTGVAITHTPELPTVPRSYGVLQAFPNPFNPTTTLRVQLPAGVRSDRVSLVIYNTLGQQVKRFDVSALSPNAYVDLVWNGKDESGRTVASGMYLAVLTTPERLYSVKLMMLK